MKRGVEETDRKASDKSPQGEIAECADEAECGDENIEERIGGFTTWKRNKLKK